MINQSVILKPHSLTDRIALALELLEQLAYSHPRKELQHRSNSTAELKFMLIFFFTNVIFKENKQFTHCFVYDYVNKKNSAKIEIQYKLVTHIINYDYIKRLNTLIFQDRWGKITYKKNGVFFRKKKKKTSIAKQSTFFG